MRRNGDVERTNPFDLNGKILRRMDLHDRTGEHSVLAELVGRLRVHFAATAEGDVDLAEYELSCIRTAVAPDQVEAMLRDAGAGAEPPADWQHNVWRGVRKAQSWRWWQPLSSRMCMALVVLAAVGVSASVTAVAMRLRASDAEVQLQQCRSGR